jgi:Na+/H+-dicarboxylate symporter
MKDLYFNFHILTAEMKLKFPKLHNQILIALILGAIFGSIFNVSRTSLIISHKKNKEIITTTIKDWEKFSIISGKGTRDSIAFKAHQQIEIFNYFKKILTKEKDISIMLEKYYSQDSDEPTNLRLIESVVSIEREKTIATQIKWLGDIFIRLLNMIAIPLVLGSLTVGAASLGDIKKFARIGGKTLAFYLITTAIAITIGLVAANLIQPGERMNFETKERLLSVFSKDVEARVESAEEYDFIQEIVKIIPRNPFAAIANAEMLQVVLFAVMLGLVLSLIPKTKGEPVIKFFDGLSEAMIKMVDLIMLIAPIGVFALISATVGEFGFDILRTLFWYAATVLIGLITHTLGIYSLIIKWFSKIKVITFFKGMRKAQTIAFSTSSSAATLPVNMECCNENLKVSKSITSFVLPLGATINMDGTALYQGVAAVFIAQVFGMDLNLMQQFTIVLTATLASIGTAPVPGVGIIMLIIVLKSVGIPEEGIALILGVDRILDMCRTITNVTGDAAVAVAVASSEGEILHPNLKDA